MIYIKRNLNDLLLIIKEIPQKQVMLTSLYGMIFFFFLLFLTYLVSVMGTKNEITQTLMALTNFMTVLILPASMVIILAKTKDEGRFLKNLKYFLHPIIRYELIIYSMLSGLLLLFVVSMFLRLAPGLTDFLEVAYKYVVESYDDNSLESLIKVMEERSPEVLKAFYVEVRSWFFAALAFGTIVLLFLLITFFLITTHVMLSKDLGIIKNIKESFKMIKNNVISVIIVMLSFFTLLTLANKVSVENILIFYFLIWFKFFLLAFLINALLIIGNENKDKKSANDENIEDVYNVEV